MLSLVYALNVTQNDTTGFSPFYLIFDRHPRLAIGAFLGPNICRVWSKSGQITSKFQSRLAFANRRFLMRLRVRQSGTRSSMTRRFGQADGGRNGLDQAFRSEG